MKVAGWCEAHYVDLMPHNPLGPICTAASVHLAAAVPNFAWLEMPLLADRGARLLRPGLLPGPARAGGRATPVPDGPGLGVEVNEARVARAAFRFWEAPHLRRRDGTNW